MGKTRSTSSDWAAYASTASTKSYTDTFKSSHMKSDWDPKNITLRESRDSDANPLSKGIILGLDVTGSMGDIAYTMAKTGLATVMMSIFQKFTEFDPHILTMGIGDVWVGDKAPLQVTQFESDLLIAQQLTDLYVEQGGGGNLFESYNLPWYFAGTRTALDCFEKRNQKGYLFTIGDERPPGDLSASDLKKVFGDGQFSNVSTEECLRLAQKYYHVFHVVVEEGNHCKVYGSDLVIKEWQNLMGQNVLPLSNYNKLAEVVVSTMQVIEGQDEADVVSAWDGDTSLVVSKALNALDIKKPNDNDELVIYS